jgi:hypothetical protein
MKFIVDISGDKETIQKINDLGGDLDRWGWNAAFRPAAYSFLPPLNAAAWSPTPGKSSIEHRTYRLGKIGPYLRVRAVKRNADFAGVVAMSQFGTRSAKDDPYYGAFVNWGHVIWTHGKPTDKKTTPKLQEEQAWDKNLDRAKALAVANLRSVITNLWYTGSLAGMSAADS